MKRFLDIVAKVWIAVFLSCFLGFLGYGLYEVLTHAPVVLLMVVGIPISMIITAWAMDRTS